MRTTTMINLNGLSFSQYNFYMDKRHEIIRKNKASVWIILLLVMTVFKPAIPDDIYYFTASLVLVIILMNAVLRYRGLGKLNEEYVVKNEEGGK